MTLTRIARSLGVSVTTVSRALGGYGDVAPETRARVEAEALRIDYRPNQLARRLRTGRSGAVGVVLPADPGQFDDPFFLRMLAGLGRSLAASGLDLLVGAGRAGADELRAYRRLVEDRRVDGMIVCRTRRHDARIAYLQRSGMAFVAHGRTESRAPYAHLDIDGAAACRAATERLIGFGHRRIAMLDAAAVYMFAHHREAGFRAAMRDAGLDGTAVAHGEPTEENGFRLASAMLRGPSAPTAFVCATDRLAVGCLHAIADAGLRPGRDVSVIGYDNLAMATYTDPPLTTFEQPIEEAAARLVEMLAAVIAGAPPGDFAEIWQARLVARSSDGPAPDPTALKRGSQTTDVPGETHDPHSLARR